MSAPGSPAACRGTDITAYFLRNSATPSQAVDPKMAPPRSNTAGTASLKKAGKGLPNTMQVTLQPSNRPDSPNPSPDIPGADGYSLSQGVSAQAQPSTEAWKDIIALLPTKRDIAESAASIVSTLSREIHDLKQRIDTVDSRVTVVETSSGVLESRMAALEETQNNYNDNVTTLC